MRLFKLENKTHSSIYVVANNPIEAKEFAIEFFNYGYRFARNTANIESEDVTEEFLADTGGSTLQSLLAHNTKCLASITAHGREVSWEGQLIETPEKRKENAGKGRDSITFLQRSPYF